MRPKYRDVVTAALAFIQASNRNDEVFVVNFGDRVSSGLPDDVPFTADLSQLRAALWMGSARGPDGSLRRDSVLPESSREGQVREEGPDAGQRRRRQQQRSSVRRSDADGPGVRATIYTIGIFDEDDPDRNPALLRRLAQVSGGEAYFPEQLSEVIGICRQIASDIRTRYTIGYVPVRSGEQGSLRKIKVTRRRPAGTSWWCTRARAIFFQTDAPQWTSLARRAGSRAYETSYYRPGDEPRGPWSDTSSWLSRSFASGSTAMHYLERVLYQTYESREFDRTLDRSAAVSPP